MKGHLTRLAVLTMAFGYNRVAFGTPGHLVFCGGIGLRPPIGPLSDTGMARAASGGMDIAE